MLDELELLKSFSTILSLRYWDLYKDELHCVADGRNNASLLVVWHIIWVQKVTPIHL